MYSRSRSLQASGLLAGTKPSKVAVRLSLTDWLLVVLLGTGTSLSSSTVAIQMPLWHYMHVVRVLIKGDVVARLIWGRTDKYDGTSKNSTSMLITCS